MLICYILNGLVGVWNVVMFDLVGILVCLRFWYFKYERT